MSWRCHAFVFICWPMFLILCFWTGEEAMRLFAQLLIKESERFGFDLVENGENWGRDDSCLITVIIIIIIIIKVGRLTAGPTRTLTALKSRKWLRHPDSMSHCTLRRSTTLLQIWILYLHSFYKFQLTRKWFRATTSEPEVEVIATSSRALWRSTTFPQKILVYLDAFYKFQLTKPSSLKRNECWNVWGCHMENILDIEKTRSTSSKQNSMFFRAMLVALL
jgi:hypothetical protein